MIRTFNNKSPGIHPDAFISEAAYIVGDVMLGEGSNVWPGAVIRGDTGPITIGKNVSIQDGCVIHSGHEPDTTVIIGDAVMMGHGALIHARRIGNRVLVGMNATILPGAEIGNDCIIGAGCVVPEMKVPDGSFIVGVPGKIKGKATEEQLKSVEEAALQYAERGRRYKAEGL
ncbi:MAG TPA: gamma carbonic anhydrase family protein [Dehalococcoidales bacterium]|nr:gamma carbonic anhydrase family protein [Dehalococcoidales bacterium]